MFRKKDSVDYAVGGKDGESRKGWLVPVLVVLLLGAIGSAIFMGLKYQDVKKNPQNLVQADQQKIVDKVGKLISLPNDEQPSIATVSDKNKLSEQAFFKNSKNGDTLLIYTKARKAILYRESENKVVEVAPIAIDTTTEDTKATPAATTEPDADKKQ